MTQLHNPCRIEVSKAKRNTVATENVLKGEKHTTLRLKSPLALAASHGVSKKALKIECGAQKP